MLLTAYPQEYDKDIQSRVFAGITEGLERAAWMKYFNISNQQSYTLNTTGFSGFDSVPQWRDGAELPLDEAERIWNMTLTMLFYGMGFKVTRKHQEYGQARVIQGWADSLAMSVEHTYGTLHVAMLDGAFTTNIASLGTVPLIATTHPTAGVTTRSNLAPAAALTSANLDVVRQRAANWINYRGINTPVQLRGNGSKLIVPTELIRTAEKIVGSVAEPFTTDNDKNTFAGAFEIVEEVRLTSPTAYFLQGPRHGMLSNHGLSPRPIRYMENSGNLVHGVEFDMVTGVEYADGMFGSAGA